MRFPDVTKSHVDSPDFKRDLSELEHVTESLNTHTQAVLNLLSEKAALARRDIQLTKLLVSEINCMGATHVVEFEEGEEDSEVAVNQVSALPYRSENYNVWL